jgi:NAD(P)-dependent dehydrogenase (short-subunit alcohol dehydrogenase family)
VFVCADLGCQREVRRLAEAVLSQVTTLDVLINNAGARFDHFGQTVDGTERTFAINHLGHFLLTALLLDRLLAAPAARVILTGSCAHQYVRAEGDWCLGQSDWDKRMAYGKSKLANIVFAYELSRRLKDTRVMVNAADPGTPLTRFARNNGWISWLKHVAYHFFRRELTLPSSAGRLLAGLALDEAYAGISGRYLSSSGPTQSSEASHDPDVAARLWNLSLKLVGMDESVGSTWTYLQPSA